MKKPTFETEIEDELGQENDIENQEILESENGNRFETIPVFEERIRSEIKDIEEKSEFYFLFLKKIFDEKKELDKIKGLIRNEDDEYFDNLSLEDLDKEFKKNHQKLSVSSKEHYHLIEEFRSIRNKKNITEDNILSNFLNAQNIHSQYCKNYNNLLSFKEKIDKIKSKVFEKISDELDANNIDEYKLSGFIFDKIYSKKQEIKKVKSFLGIGRFSNKAQLNSLEEELKRLEYLRSLDSSLFNFDNSSTFTISDYEYDYLLKQCDLVIKDKFKKIGDELKDSDNDFKEILSKDNIDSISQEKVDLHILEKLNELQGDYTEEEKSILIELGKKTAEYISIEKEAYQYTVEGLSSDDKRNKYNEYNYLLKKIPKPFKHIIQELIKNWHLFSESTIFTSLNSVNNVYNSYNKNLISDSVSKIKESCENNLHKPLSPYDEHDWSEIGIGIGKNNKERLMSNTIQSFKQLFFDPQNNIFTDNIILNSESSVLKERFGGDFDIKFKKMMGSVVEYSCLNNLSVDWNEFMYFINKDNALMFIISKTAYDFEYIIKNNAFILNALKNFLSDFEQMKEIDPLTKEIIDIIKNGDLDNFKDRMDILIDKFLEKDPSRNNLLTIKYWNKNLTSFEFVEKIIKNKDFLKNLDYVNVTTVSKVFLDTWTNPKNINMEMFDLLEVWKEKYLFNVHDWSSDFMQSIIENNSDLSEEFLNRVSSLLGINIEDIKNPGLNLVKIFTDNNCYSAVFNNIDKFTNEDFSCDKLLSIIIEKNKDPYRLKDVLKNNIDKFKNLSLESYNELIKFDIDLCLNNITIFKEVPEDLIVFKKVFQHSFNSIIYFNLRSLFDEGELPDHLKKIGITEKGEKGVIKAREILKESVFNLFSDNPSNWENIIESDLMMNYLSNYVKYSDSQFGQHDLASFGKVLTTYQEQQKMGEIEPVPEYIKPQTIEVKKITTEVIPWTESAYSRFETIMDSYRKVNDHFSAESKPFTKIIEEVESYRNTLLDDLEEKLSKIEKPEAKIGIQKKIDNIKNLNFRSIEDFFTNIVSLSKDPDTHVFLRKALFLVTLWKRPETRVDYFGDTALDIDNATKLDEFISHIMNQEVFGSIYDKQNHKGSGKLPKKSDVLKAIKNIMNNHAINVELEQFMSKQNSDEKIEIELIPSRGPIMEFSGHIASACWASKYKSISAMFPNITSVIFKEKIDNESSKLSGAFLLIESVDKDNNKVLIIRGLNPLDSLLNKVDIDDLYIKIKEYVSKIAKDDERTPLIVIDDHSGGSSTNRPRLYSLAHFIDAKPNKLVPLGKPDEIKTKNSTYHYSEKEYRGGNTFNGYVIDNVCYKI